MSGSASSDEEVDFLLRSLDDLDAEHDAGDLDEDDYQVLRDGYTARAAAVLRAREAHEEPPAPPTEPRRRRTALVWVVGVLAVAALSGVLLARSVGARGAGTSLTGSGGSVREKKADCLSASFRTPKQGITCYAAVLRQQPDDVEALTYQGWAMARSGDQPGALRNFDRVAKLDPRYPDVHVFRASVLDRQGNPAGAQAELDALYALDPPAGILSTLQDMGLDRQIAFELLSPTLQGCWQQVEQAAGMGSDKSDQAGKLFAQGITCVSDVVAASPGDISALAMQGYLLGSSDDATLQAKAAIALDRAVGLAPQDPTVRLLRAALRNVTGDPAGSIADLDVLATLPGRPNALYVLASPADIRRSAQEALASPSTTTTTTTTG